MIYSNGRTRKENLERLQRRADHLTKRIDAATAEGKDLNWDKAERSAIIWAIENLQEDTRPEARRIDSYKPDEIDLMVDHYFAHTIDLMHAGCHDKIREAVHGIFQDARIAELKRREPQNDERTKP